MVFNYTEEDAEKRNLPQHCETEAVKVQIFYKLVFLIVLYSIKVHAIFHTSSSTVSLYNPQQLSMTYITQSILYIIHPKIILYIK